LLLRITLSDGTITEMSFSGTAPNNTIYNDVCSDDTFLYIGNGQDAADRVVRKYSVSGTTATYVDARTLADEFGETLATDGTHFWWVTGDSASVARNLYKALLDATPVSNRYLQMTSSYCKGVMVYQSKIYANFEVSTGQVGIRAVDNV